MKTVVITGASKGIGFELGKLYVENGFKVICLSRSAPLCEDILHIPCDISDIKSVESAAQQIEKIDILVNNAGIGVGGSVEWTSFEDAKRIIDVNFLGLFNVTSVFLGKLRDKKGRIVNVSSVAGEFGIPYQTLYGATKAAMNAFSDGLRNELRTFGVRVLNVMPGDTKTEFARLKNKQDGEYTEFSDRSIAIMERDEQRGMTGKYVARKIYRWSRRKRIPQSKVVGRKFGFLLFLSRFLPRRFVNYLVYKLYGGAK